MCGAVAARLRRGCGAVAARVPSNSGRGFSLKILCA